MNLLQKVFTTTLLVESIAVLSTTAHLVATRNYRTDNLILIGAFCVPVVIAMVLSASLLFNQTSKRVN